MLELIFNIIALVAHTALDYFFTFKIKKEEQE